MTITKITEPCWQGILTVQAQAYSGVSPESLNVLKSKWQASADLCFVYKDMHNKVQGYLLAHSWNSQVPPKLFEILPNDSSGDVLYLHDLAISHHTQGKGIAGQLFHKLWQRAKIQPYQRILLVAVQASERYWFKHGFREVPNATVCESYGKDATLMTLDLEK